MGNDGYIKTSFRNPFITYFNRYGATNMIQNSYICTATLQHYNLTLTKLTTI